MFGRVLNTQLCAKMQTYQQPDIHVTPSTFQK